MAKGTRVQSRRSSAIRLVQEDGAPAIPNPDVNPNLDPGRTPPLVKQFPRQTSTAIYHLQEARRSSPSSKRAPLFLVNPETVLKELFELLEDYAPIWYTEEKHNRAVAALAQITR